MYMENQYVMRSWFRLISSSEKEEKKEKEEFLIFLVVVAFAG